MRKINLIVVHCSATRETVAYTPEQLERDHKARGFTRAGYNYYIRRDGHIVDMRPSVTKADWTTPAARPTRAPRRKRNRSSGCSAG